MYNPSDKEQEYFLRQEAERLKKLREEHQKKLAVDEAQRLKELHFMHCPKCGATMDTTAMAKVDVDICPGCGGIYLDAGELDKVLEEKNRGPFAVAAQSLRDFFKG
jgi:uncharacterized protein